MKCVLKLKQDTESRSLTVYVHCIAIDMTLFFCIGKIADD